jgi:nitroreductase
MALSAHMERILDLARWTPSGDNTQPWRFEVINDERMVIHGFDTRENCVYDLQGHASQLALGALLETLSIAATGEGMQTTIKRRNDTPVTLPTFDVIFSRRVDLRADPLLSYIRQRCTQRRAFHTRPLAHHERATLEAALPTGYRVHWLEGLSAKLRMAKLLFANAGIRLTIPEAYEVHKRIIQWHARYSDDRIPDQAVGLDPLTTRLMEWAMQSWPRVRFMNRYLAGTILPRLQLDIIPALACAAHFMIVADHAAQEADDYFAAGRALQRFWLTATSLGLQFQPEMTPLIFASYARQNLPFTHSTKQQNQARLLTANLEQLFGQDISRRAVFMGRIGAGDPPGARSRRRPLAELLKK